MQEPTSSYRKVDGGGPSIVSRLVKCICNLVSCAFTILTLYFLWEALGRPNLGDAFSNLDVSDFDNVLGNITDEDWGAGFNEDPYVGDSALHVWKQSKGNGLELTLQNALDEYWQTEFEAAVEDWSESNALDLTVVKVDVDNECKRESGVMKVCNGNYGQTGWLGINELEYEVKGKDVMYITSSVAKMNEQYLHNADYEQRQYTMCHEIGHGFGLPHTDENMYNADQGNCLDYTTKPSNNIHPGEVNFEKLEQMYLDGANDDGENRNFRRTIEEEEHIISTAETDPSHVRRRVIRRVYLWA